MYNFCFIQNLPTAKAARQIEAKVGKAAIVNFFNTQRREMKFTFLKTAWKDVQLLFYKKSSHSKSRTSN